MQAHAQVSVHLSRTYKGRQRPTPVWVMRYRLASGKDSKKVIGRAWLRRGRPRLGFMTESDALLKARAFAAEHGADTADVRRTFRVALDAFVAHCTNERRLRNSTVHEYRRIGGRLAAREWRGELKWADRPLDAFDGSDLCAVRNELLKAGRDASTLNHYRRVVRGVFGTAPSSAALAWDWSTQKVESEGKLRFYTPAQVRRLIAHAHSPLDRAIYVLAAEAGPRLSEIRGLKVTNVDFDVAIIRFEDGFTTHGGHAGNKGRRVRSVPMTANIRAALWPYCNGRGGEELVFEHDAKPGEPICGVSLYRRFVTTAKRAELPRLRLHDLRHTFGTQAIRVFRVHEVQGLMGHRHITTTERYLHYAPDPDAAAKLSALWAEPAGENVVAFARPAEASADSSATGDATAEDGVAADG